jgi:PleD family two-component response regulator
MDLNPAIQQDEYMSGRFVRRPVTCTTVSGVDDSDDQVHGFQEGGVDYITKPIRQEVVPVRVATHLELNLKARKLHFFTIDIMKI